MESGTLVKLVAFQPGRARKFTVFLLSEYHARKVVPGTEETGAHDTSAQRRQQHPFFRAWHGIHSSRPKDLRVDSPKVKPLRSPPLKYGGCGRNPPKNSRKTSGDSVGVPAIHGGEDVKSKSFCGSQFPRGRRAVHERIVPEPWGRNPPPGVSTVEFTVAAKHDARIGDKPANIVLAHGRSYDFLLFFATCDL